MSTANKPQGGERKVPCPSCKNPAVFSPRNPWRPFCGERCRNVDLGAWASEQFRVPAPAPVDSARDDDPGVQGGH